VTSRGVGGTHIYVDDDDREAFRMLLAQVVEMFGWRLHAWCLMGTQKDLTGGSSRLRWGRWMRYARMG
jgi:hypothetical protein